MKTISSNEKAEENLFSLYCSGEYNKENKYGGIGIVLVHDMEVKEIFMQIKHSTENRIKLMAILEGLKEIKRRKSNERIAVYSDSEYIVNVVTKKYYLAWSRNDWRLKSGKKLGNWDLWDQLLNFLPEAKFIYVKNPEDNVYSLFAYNLARKAVKEQ